LLGAWCSRFVPQTAPKTRRRSRRRRSSGRRFAKQTRREQFQANCFWLSLISRQFRLLSAPKSKLLKWFLRSGREITSWACDCNACMKFLALAPNTA